MESPKQILGLSVDVFADSPGVNCMFIWSEFAKPKLSYTVTEYVPGVLAIIVELVSPFTFGPFHK